MSVYVKFTKFEGREGTTEIEKVPVRGEDYIEIDNLYGG